MRNYGEALKYQRENNNLSQTELAKQIGVTQQAISYYENNKNEPTIGICEKLADFYGITIDELIGRDHGRITNSITYNNSTHNGNNLF